MNNDYVLSAKIGSANFLQCPHCGFLHEHPERFFVDDFAEVECEDCEERFMAMREKRYTAERLPHA